VCVYVGVHVGVKGEIIVRGCEEESERLEVVGTGRSIGDREDIVAGRNLVRARGSETNLTLLFLTSPTQIDRAHAPYTVHNRSTADAPSIGVLSLLKHAANCSDGVRPRDEKLNLIESCTSHRASDT
jgi:hypothetical protein